MLKNIVDFRFGINATNSVNGLIPCIKASNFDEYNRLNTTHLTFISENQVRDSDILKDGEVLFAAKGSRNLAVEWRNEFLEMAVASSTFIIMTKKRHGLLPSYLAWYLMSGKAERYFYKYAKEGTVKSINKKSLELLDIEIPPISKQKRIVKLCELYHKERQLMEEISLNREKIIRNL